MKMRVMAGLLALAATMAVASQSQASVSVGDQLKFTQITGGNGGIFKADNITTNGSFETFCVEIGEHINPGSTVYTVRGLGTTTVNTGFNLSSYTAWLYNSFLNNTLSGGFSSGTTNHARALQMLIWREMGYTDAQIKGVGSAYNNANFTTLEGLLTGAFAGWMTDFNNAVSNNLWFDLGPGVGFTDGVSGTVKVIDLAGANGTGNYQDQLVRVPGGPGNSVPEAGSLAIWGLLGMATAVGCRWRRKKVAA